MSELGKLSQETPFVHFRHLHFGGCFEEREMEERVTAIIWGILKWRLIETISKLTLDDAIHFDHPSISD